MIEKIQFKNFKALRDSTLPLGPFTLLVGPNGSGKSTVFQALQGLSGQVDLEYSAMVSAGVSPSTPVEVFVYWKPIEDNVVSIRQWKSSGTGLLGHYRRDDQSGSVSRHVSEDRTKILSGLKVFSFSGSAITRIVSLEPLASLNSDGSNLAGVLDHVRDQSPERFESLNDELKRWLPEFDRILFETPGTGKRAFLLRTQDGHAIPASQLSEGTLLSFALLTLAYLPDPPSILCIEEPERGIHPRMLRNVQDALYRLSHPESVGETRPAVQVIATTHSPYFLDLYREHPEEIVIAEKVDGNVVFHRLSDRQDLKETIGDAPLGEAWYSGILGGVPTTTP